MSVGEYEALRLVPECPWTGHRAQAARGFLTAFPCGRRLPFLAQLGAEHLLTALDWVCLWMRHGWGLSEQLGSEAE